MPCSQVNLTHANREKLEALARRTGRSTDRLINEAVQQWVVDHSAYEEDESGADLEDWRAAMERAAGIWKERDDIAELMQQVRREMNRVEPPE